MPQTTSSAMLTHAPADTPSLSLLVDAHAHGYHSTRVRVRLSPRLVRSHLRIQRFFTEPQERGMLGVDHLREIVAEVEPVLLLPRADGDEDVAIDEALLNGQGTLADSMQIVYSRDGVRFRGLTAAMRPFTTELTSYDGLRALLA